MSLSCSYQMGNFPAILFSYLPKWVENLILHKNLHRNVISSLFITAKAHKHKSQSTKISFYMWMDKQLITQEILFINKINELSNCKKIQGGNLNAYWWVKEANMKRPHTVLFQIYDTQLPAVTDHFTFSIDLPFLECHIFGIIQYAALFRLANLWGQEKD